MNKSTTVGQLIVTILTTIILIFIAQFISFWICYAAGWIAKITIGNALTKGLSLLNLTILPDQIPFLAGAIGWIASFFNSTRFNSNNSNK